MTDEERQQWLEAGTIADQQHDWEKLNGKRNTLSQSLLNYENKRRMDSWGKA